jgi:hypothetical protein
VFLGGEGKTGKVALVSRHADKYTPLGKIPKPLPICQLRLPSGEFTSGGEIVALTSFGAQLRMQWSRTLWQVIQGFARLRGEISECYLAISIVAILLQGQMEMNVEQPSRV